MPKFKIAAVSLAALSLAACSQVTSGHVGIKVNQFGSDAGVDHTALGVGTYFTPPGTAIYEYPVYTNTYTFTQSVNEGKSVNEEIPCQTIEGTALTTDIGVSYSVDHTLAPTLYQKYRQKMEDIVAGPIHNEIRNQMSLACATYKVDEAYGPKKAELLSRVEAGTRAYFKPFGLNIESLFWAGRIRPPASIEAQINGKIANEQEALAEQAKVATFEALAQQRIAQANGEAKAIQVQGDALRANPQVLELKKLEKWDGHLPQVTGGANPFVSLKE